MDIFSRLKKSKSLHNLWQKKDNDGQSRPEMVAPTPQKRTKINIGEFCGLQSCVNLPDIMLIV